MILSPIFLRFDDTLNENFVDRRKFYLVFARERLIKKKKRKEELVCLYFFAVFFQIF